MRLYVALTIITWVCLTILIGLDTKPLSFLGLGEHVYQYRLGSVAQKDIYAQRNATYEDPVATQEARRQAEDNVPSVYRQDPKVDNQVQSNVRNFFNKVHKIRSSNSSSGKKISQVMNASPFYLPPDSARSLVFMKKDDVNNVERYVIENLKELYKSTAVADNNIPETPAAVITLSAARDRLSEAAGRDASGDVGALVDILSRGFLEPNYVVDHKATQKAREQAASSVKPVMGSVRQGQLVLARGEVVDKTDLAQLKALGRVGSSNPWTVLLGVGLVVSAEMGIAWYFLERFGRRILKSQSVIRIVLAASLMILFTALARGFMLFSTNPYLIPLAGLSILGTILLGPRLMFLMVVISSVNVGIIGGNDDLLTAAMMLSSGFAIYTVVRVDSRTELLRAGIFIAAVMGIVTFAVSLIGGGGLRVALRMGGYGVANGLLSLMIAMVLLPFLESAFNILTPMRLLELSDPGNPLLQKLLRRAPGTFSHSMQVGNLAENAAERIGANALLARVGSYYHDIGKMEHPTYFIENQIAHSNPHASLSPALSAKILKRHVKDGVEIGRAWDLPEEIIAIIAQHHGTSRIEYFYRKALQQNVNGEGVRESDFRYPGSLPRSKEAGIVMLADSVEATVKSLEKPTPKRVEDVVENTIRTKLEDGQFEECELTVNEIRKVGDAIREALIGFLGPRIEYPEAPPKSGASVSKTAKNAT